MGPVCSGARVWPAKSVSRCVVECLSGRRIPLRLLSVHSRACNLLSSQGDLIALVTEAVSNGPFHIVLAGSVPSLERFDPGDSAWWCGDHLWLGNVLVSLEEAAVWEPRVTWPNPPVGVRAMGELAGYVAPRVAASPFALLDDGGLTSLRDVFPAGEGAAVREEGSSCKLWSVTLAERASAVAHQLLAGLRMGDGAAVIAGAQGLAGLGPGLTPSGDDFLVGLMAGIRAWPAFLGGGWTAEQACRQIAWAAVPGTTVLSAAWLRHAADGAFGEAWHGLIRALTSGDDAVIRTAADRILDMGATSGADAMVGFLAPFWAWCRFAALTGGLCGDRLSSLGG